MELINKQELQEIGKHLLAEEQTIAVAESVTAGLLQFALSNIENAAKFFQGGLTAYNLGQKYKHLQVEPIHAQQMNCVSEQVVKQMALNICKAFQSQWGVAISGYASPVPQSEHKLYAFYAIVFEGQVADSGKIEGTKDNPPDVQAQYVEVVARHLLKKLKDKVANPH